MAKYVYYNVAVTFLYISYDMFFLKGTNEIYLHILEYQEQIILYKISW